MANLRILYNDIVANTSALTANNTAIGLGAVNMKSEVKSEIHRSTGTSVSYTLAWATNQSINTVVLPCTNLSGTSTVRVRLYDAASALLYDSTTVPAVPGFNLDISSVTHNANLFAYGYMSKTAIWIPTIYNTVRSCIIDLVDTSNITGYIDCSKILAGVYWESSNNVENGIQIQSIDGSNISRTNAGELVYDAGFTYDKISFNFALLSENDRTELLKIIRRIGITKNIFISVFPEYTVSTVEQDYMLYGKRSNAALTYKIFGFYNHSMEITSW
jgi:hypothetical protein